MAYGNKRKYGASRKYGRGSKFTPRKRNSARKVPVPRKRTSQTRRNALAINSLARVQRKIRNLAYGMLQTSYDTTAPLADGLELRVTNLTPILFDSADFTREYTNTVGHTQHGCRVFTTHPVDQHHETIDISHFKQITDAVYRKDQMHDIVNGGKYLPVRGNYTLKFEGLNINRPVRVIIQLFVQKTQNFTLPYGQGAKEWLPHSLPHLQDLADPTKNQLSYEHFKLYKKKVVMLYPPTVTGATSQKYCYFNVQPKKVRTQTVTTPIDMNDPEEEVPDGNFGFLNVPLGTPFWCLISSDAVHTPGTLVSTDSNHVKVSIARNVAWRDHTGAA